MQFTYELGSFSFFDTSGHGWKNFQFELNGQLSSSYTELENKITSTGGTVKLAGQGVNETIHFTTDAAASSLVVSRTITNTEDSPLVFKSVSDGILSADGEICFDEPFSPIDYYKLRYFHSSNIKTEKFPRFRVEHPYVKCIPYDAVHFNHDEANHFPVFGVTADRDYVCTLVQGDLNQVQFERSWELGLDGISESKLAKTYKGIQRFTLSNGFSLAAGERVEVSRVFYQLKYDTHPQYAFDDYVAKLNQHHNFQGKNSKMLREGVFCTWNYGTFGNITEDLILNRAKAMAENMPNCTHFLIDDGYQALRNSYNNPNAGIDSFYPVPVEGYDKEKFPNGMKIVADGIRDLGLKPCIWLSPKVYLSSPLAKEKPEWLQKDKDGSVRIIGQSSFLDLSHPEAREFYLKVLDALFVQWGFEGVKYDFMTQWFLKEDSRFGHKSGIEWRDFAFSEIRKRIGDEGFFMTCIAFSAGNPFPGLNADSYRCGFDIHDGTWSEQVRACSGTLAQTMIKGKDTFLLNMDSLGFGDNPENEQFFRLNWCYITQGILEFGGKLEEHTPEQFTIFNKLLTNADRGNKVHVLDDKAFTGEPLPEILQVRYEDDGPMKQAGVKQHIAFFNWSNESKLITLSLDKAQLSAKEQLSDFWSHESITVNGQYLCVELAPRSSQLIEVK
ncbi:alpha-1,6-galactosidase, putative [Lentisphaera araneosa HTCC2155]|uniref:Alpha-1,6-galactosidase, putative n=1 Tax=Lentisphaera araneosa HTCC2155 TaxID=313628 RepID=A6DLW2_9BACT|nr:alpha-galactosidase [Lentisphaera araneosa]EDM27260.1 alpha-1,6-galactosidase, putative [Lentisphaera araneosa HTCC2155]